MINWLGKFLRREDGSVLPIFAIAAPVILGMTALGADGSYYIMTKSNLQTAADAAAYSAAWEMSKAVMTITNTPLNSKPNAMALILKLAR